MNGRTKRAACAILAGLLSLSLWGCGRKETEEETLQPLPAPAVSAVPEPTPAPSPRAQTFPRSSYRSVEITAENWSDYFELKEIPLYTSNSSGAISTVTQYYCVVLREGYQPYLDPEWEGRVEFQLSFDLYINRLDIDTKEYRYGHTDDLLYAVDTVKTAVFDRNALPASAYGGDRDRYSGFSNAFFSGQANLNVDYKVWTGFYIDLSQVRIDSVSGSVSLALG